MSIPILNKNHTPQQQQPQSSSSAAAALSWMDDYYEGRTLSMQGSFLVIKKAWEHKDNNSNHFDPCQEEHGHHDLMATPCLMSSTKRASHSSSNSSSMDDCSSISSSSTSSGDHTMINISASSMRDSFLHVNLAASTANDSGRAQHHPYARWTHETQTGARQPRWSLTTATAALTRPLCGNTSTNNIGPYDLTLSQKEDRECFLQDDDCCAVDDEEENDDDDDETVVDKDEQEQEQFQKQVPDKPLRRPSLLSALLCGDGSHTVVNGSSPPPPPVHLICEENKEQQHPSSPPLFPSPDYCKKNINNNDHLSSSLQYCVDWEQLQNAGPLFVTTTTTTLISQPGEQMAPTLHYRLEPFHSGWW